MQRLFIILITGILIFNIIGCATVQSLDRIKGQNKEVVSDIFGNNFDEVFEVAKESCVNNGLAIIQMDKNKGRIYAKTSPTLLQAVSYQYGEWIGIYITSIDANKTKIEIVTQKTYYGSFWIAWRDYRGNILNSMRSLLKR